jgi:hypothetical protein
LNDKIELEGNEFLRPKPRTIYPYVLEIKPLA